MVAFLYGHRVYYEVIMSTFYTDVRLRGNKILTSGYADGVRFRDDIPYQPTFYITSNKEENFKSLSGQNLAPITFESPFEAKQGLKSYTGISNFEVYGNPKYETAFISQTYPASKVDYDPEYIDFTVLDIETTTKYGNIDVFNTPEEITLITLISKKHGTITFGSREYTGKYKDTYQFCHNEAALLKRFLEYWTYHMPDVITGWNCDWFDLPYIYGRISIVLGEQFVKMLSPWKLVNIRETQNNNKPALKVDIFGIQQLDYMALYKKFGLIPRENYKLDTIAFCEIKAQKLKNPFKTFREFYENDWELFCEYNIRDCELVMMLDDKLGLLAIAFTVAYSAHINYGDVFSPVRCWESIISHALISKGIVIPCESAGNASAHYEGAYVKEPKRGLMKWNASFDAKALYPSIIIQHNISPDTLVPKLLDLTPDNLFDNEYTFDKEYCITANGTMYRKDIRGFLPELMAEFLDDRDVFKGIMLDAKRKLETVTDELEKIELNKIVAKNRNLEQALKILLNAAYGALANKHFIFFDVRLAEAITLTGQAILKCADKAFNDYFVKIGMPEDDYVIYEDTDSCYVNVNPLVEKYFPDLSDDEKVDKIDAICKQKFAPMLDAAFDKFIERTNAYEKRIFFKRENIASKGFWKEKKKYVLKVHDSEGVRYKTPSLKVMGLEIVRSSTPEIVRESLTECVNMILDKDIKDLRKYVAALEKEFKSSPPENIAFPRGVNDIEKYINKTPTYSTKEVVDFNPADLYKGGCPIAVRASILHNHFVQANNLLSRYPKINSGDKIKFIYLRKQNILRENVIAFADEFPHEIVSKKDVDYNLQWEKAFLDPLNAMLNSVGWVLKEVITLDSFMN